MEVLSLLDHHSNAEIDSRFRVVIIGIQRAKQLLQGASQVSQKPFAKETSRAIYEVLRGDVAFVVGKEACLFKEANERAQGQSIERQPSTEEFPPPTPEASVSPVAETA